MSTALPLTDLTVLEIAGRRAGAGVARMLADLGASVRKVVRPGYERSATELWLDRGKEVQVVEFGAGTNKALLNGIDVVIENGRPGRLSRFGLDAESIRTVRPDIVHLSLPGFPKTDPRSQLRVSEGVICAAAGLYAERGWSHALRGHGPAITDMPMASAYATAFGTLAVLVALLERRACGAGDTLEVSLHNALLEGLSYNHMKIDPLPDRYTDRRARVFRAHGITNEAILQRLIDPVYRSYRCADGRYFYLATPPHRDIVPRTLSALGIWDELVAAGLPLDQPYRPSASWKDRTEGSIFAPPRLADRWFDKLFDGLTRRFAEESADEWAERFLRADISGQIVQTRDEWREDPHALESGLIDRDSRKPAAFFWQASGPTKPDLKPRNDLSEVTILDLANVIAGPTCAGALARFGPRIIKIDAPTPGFDPFITVVLALQYGRGKRSILLDLHNPDGRTVFEELVRQADLVTYNGTPAQPAALGIDPATLREINPRAALVQVSAYGGPRPGSKSNCRGYDEVLQAATGIMIAHQDGDYPPEEFAQFGCVDVLTGLVGSCAAVAALLVPGSSWATSLAAGAQLIQLPLLCGERGVSGRIVELSDGHYYLDDAVPQIDGAAAMTMAELDARVQAEDWPGHRIANYAELRKRYETPEDALTKAIDAGGTAFTRDTGHPVAPVFTVLEQTAIRRGRPIVAPERLEKYGSSTRAILTALGRTDEQIDVLLHRGAVADQWPHHSQFLPD